MISVGFRSFKQFLLRVACFEQKQKGVMSNSSNIRRRVSFTPIMLTSKSIRPVNRSDYEITRNDRNLLQLANHREHLTNILFRESRHDEDRQLIDKSPDDEGFQDNEDQESYNRLIRKMTTPTVVKVQFQKELIKTRRKAELKLKEGREADSHEEVRNQHVKAFYCTNAKTFEEFTKLNKLKGSKSPNHASSENNEEKWRKYLDKYYLNIRKVKPLLRKEDGIKFLAATKIPDMHHMNTRLQLQNRESVQLLAKSKGSSPFRSHTKRQSRPKQRGGSSSVCEPSRSPDQPMNSATYKRIEQDVASHRTQTRKQFFVFGLSENVTKANQGPQLKQKLQNYWDFLFRVNFTNGLYVCSRDEGEKPLKFFVGFGNNAALIKGIMRRRYWWQLVDKITDETNFVWTQLKISDFFKSQLKNQSSPKMNKSKTRYVPSSSEQFNRAIMAGDDLRLWERYYDSNLRYEQKGFQSALSKRVASLLRGKKIDLIESSSKIRVHNHLQCNYFLGNKKALFYSIRKYYELKGIDPFTKIPLTFHITQGIEDPQFQKFFLLFQDYNERRKTNKEFKNIWIVKPGELTNRGRGITVCSTLDEIKIRLKTKERNCNGTARTFIVQKYIEKPLLYQRRKFDIRHYMAISCTNGRMKGYWYAEGYIRTTSSQYNIKNTKDLFTHLTNDAVQKNGQDYGKFQKGNKVSYADFKKYLNNTIGSDVDFFAHILPKMKEIATDSIKATYSMLDPEKKQHNFELFGLDFMLDEDLNVYLIEVNTNPCLETSCPLLTKILTPLIENLFKIFLDPLYPPPVQWPTQRKYNLGDNALEENKFSLVFDECEDGPELRELYRNADKIDDRMGDIFQEDEQYNDDEKEWNQDQQNGKK